jgi:hypothetical protein
MEFLRISRNPWGQETITGVSWELLWWFVGAAVVFIVAHAAYMMLTRLRRRPLSDADEQSIQT